MPKVIESRRVMDMNDGVRTGGFACHPQRLGKAAENPVL